MHGVDENLSMQAEVILSNSGLGYFALRAYGKLFSDLSITIKLLQAKNAPGG